MVIDQAPPHKSKKTQAFIDSPKRFHVFYLPSYSPDGNPDEYVWNPLKPQEFKGHQAKTKAELKVLAKRKLKKIGNTYKYYPTTLGRKAIAIAVKLRGTYITPLLMFYRKVGPML